MQLQTAHLDKYICKRCSLFNGQNIPTHKNRKHLGM